ncbi:short subunit dehydrogenase [Lentzea atacamensis]|uniref:Short subunit dehydrogenase n=1 Tax=Lentzea atacamensis TaxID=531938 RepID=A0A316HX52_9PSEU|nr:SDR family NAD(P)-dependent oxidoreductase [Lentzea atacamensis]PWK86024.1 short subunit dehydrogenase [Lentzea atacamensis]
MASVLIAGANSDLGLETARQLVLAGHTVWLGSGHTDRARAAGVGARFVQLDVTWDESVAAAASAVGSLDVLVNNVAELTEPGEVTAEVVRDAFEAGLAGLARVLHAFLPLLERSAAPVVVNVGSRSDPLAEAAVTMVTVQYAKAYPRMRINAVELEEGAEGILRTIDAQDG